MKYLENYSKVQLQKSCEKTLEYLSRVKLPSGIYNFSIQTTISSKWITHQDWKTSTLKFHPPQDIRLSPVIAPKDYVHC